MVGLGGANAAQLSGKTVKKVSTSKVKRMIVEKKGTDATFAAVGVGGSILAALLCWFIHKRKKK